MSLFDFGLWSCFASPILYLVGFVLMIFARHKGDSVWTLGMSSTIAACILLAQSLVILAILLLTQR